MSSTLLREQITAELRPRLWLLVGCTCLLWALACVNVVGLMFVRSTARRHQMAIRSAMGASRGALFRSDVSESIVLTLTAVALGIPLQLWCMSLIRATSPPHIVALLPSTLDVWSLTIAGAVVVATALMLALGNAYFMTRVSLNSLLRTSAKGGPAPAAAATQRVDSSGSVGLFLCSRLVRAY